MKEKFESVKQENKRLLEIINAKSLETVDIDSAFEIEKLKEQLQAKEQECEELKRLIAKQSNAKIQLSKLKDKQYKEFCDMKQTLIEIKEIAKNFIKNVSDRCVETTPMYGVHKQILQKISECEVENAR